MAFRADTREIDLLFRYCMAENKELKPIKEEVIYNELICTK